MVRSKQAGTMTVLALSAILGACAHGSGPMPVETLPTDAPPEGRSRLYLDCMTVATQGRAVGVTRFGSYLRYTCQGAPAKALFDAAEGFSRSRKLEVVEGGRITRRFSETVWDDQCWSEGEGLYTCRLTQPMNRAFVNGQDTPEAKGK